MVLLPDLGAPSTLMITLPRHLRPGAPAATSPAAGPSGQGSGNAATAWVW
jgi:hypothetical protein